MSNEICSIGIIGGRFRGRVRGNGNVHLRGEATDRLGLEGYACTLTGTAIEDNVATRRSFCLKALKREGAAKCIPFHTIVLELNAFTMVVQRSSESTGKAKGC